MGRLVLAASEGNPVVQLLDLDSGEVTPVPSSMDGGGAFDHALAREGWVAVHVGYDLAAYRNGSLLSPVMLPPAWTVCPALSRDEVLLGLYEGRSRRSGEELRVVVVDADGVVRRSASLPVWGPVGELATGVVGRDGTWSWAGEEVPPLGEGTPIGVLDGRAVVLARDGEIEVIRVDGTTVGTCTVPSGAGFGLDVQYDQWAMSLAATAWEQRGVLVVDASTGPRWFPLDLQPYHPVWLGEHELLLFELTGSGAVILDVQSGSTTSVGLSQRSPTPRVNVTGRFDPAEIRALLRPPRSLPLSIEEREEALAEARRGIDATAGADVRRHLDQARPAVRLRAYLPPRRVPLGSSRLGGRPDLPAGRRWPARGGRPMAFLAQLRLDEISPAAPEGSLPTKGLLLVFVDLEPDGGYPANENAVHAEIFEDTSLKRAAWPKHLVDELRFGVAAIVPEPFLSLPSLPPDLTVDDAAWSELLDAVTPRPPHHRMLGYPYSIQEQEAPVDEHGEFTLLLQLDGDGICGMSFGDGGSLQFWVPQGSLARSDLSGCVVGLDSY